MVDSNSKEPAQTLDHKGVTILPSSTTSKQDENIIPSNVKNLEDILEDLGCFGPYQVLVLISYLFLEIAAAFVAFISICIGKSTSTFESCHFEHKFKLLDQNQSYITTNLTTYSTPEVTTFIEKSLLDSFRDIWDSPFKYESIVDEWDLKCDRAWITDIFTTFLMAGMMFGGLLWSAVADWYGRRNAYISVLFVLFSGTFLSAISPNVYVYAIARFIAGSGFSGFCNVSSMTVIEFMTPKWRSLANVVGLMGEGVILLSVMGYYIRPWRQLYLATLFPYVLIIPLYFFLPESPRWLLRNKKVKEAHSVFENMAKINSRPVVSMETLEKILKHEDLASESQQKQRISYVDFLKTKYLLKPTVFLLALWFSWNVSYYGISYNIRNVPGNRYFNLALIGLAIAMGQRSSMVICDRFGRRRAVLIGMSLSAVFLVNLAVCFLTLKSVSATMILVGCFVGLFGMACTKASLRLLSGESYPTAVRTMGLGLGDLGANSAGLLTPQTAYLGSRWPALPFFIFAGISVFGSLVVFKMKETSGNPLSDEIELTTKKKITIINETEGEGQP